MHPRGLVGQFLDRSGLGRGRRVYATTLMILKQLSVLPVVSGDIVVVSGLGPGLTRAAMLFRG
jgi:hypothetical protein